MHAGKRVDTGDGRVLGEALVEKIRANQWSRVPECTAIFLRQ